MRVLWSNYNTPGYMPEGIEVGMWEMPEQLCLIKTLLPKAEMTELTYMSVLVARCFDKLSRKLSNERRVYLGSCSIMAEAIARGDWVSWSHWIYSQATESNEGFCSAIFMQSKISSQEIGPFTLGRFSHTN